jgi:hypothetical protein
MYITICVLFACIAFCGVISWHQYAKSPRATWKPGQDARPDDRHLRPTDADGAADWLALQQALRTTDAYSPLHDGEIHESWREYWRGLRHPK